MGLEWVRQGFKYFLSMQSSKMLAFIHRKVPLCMFFGTLKTKEYFLICYEMMNNFIKIEKNILKNKNKSL